MDVQSFVRREGGAEAWHRLRETLPRDEQLAVESVSAVGWYPCELFLRVLGRMHEVLGRDRVETLHAYGAFAAERHVSRVYRVLFMVLNPALMLEKTGEYWHRFYDTGEWKITRESPTRVRGDLIGFALPSADLCEFLTVYIPTMFQRIGARDARCSHPRCRARGDATCSFQVEWRA